MLVCKKCGADNPLGRVFCGSCGGKLDMTDITSDTLADQQRASFFVAHYKKFLLVLLLLVLATVGLTLIISLGSVMRPIQEYGVGPRQVFQILLLFLPITLTFILPMAALFAAALAYGRLAADNEIDACKASGISLLTLVYPGLALAIAVATANLLLSFHVMPYFVRLAEKAISEM